MDTIAIRDITIDLPSKLTHPGDAITEDLYWQMLEAVPPRTHAATLMQMGEPMDHNGPDDCARFWTFQKHDDGKWYFTGRRPAGNRVQLVGTCVLAVTGRLWRDVEGNTHHTTTVLMDGVEAFKSPVTYGYGNHYEHTTVEWLNQAFPGSGEDSCEALHRWCERKGWKLENERVSVDRKRDL